MTSEDIAKKNKAKMLFLKSVVGVVVVTILSLFVWYNYLDPEVKAKKCVNNYLRAINKGQDTDEYKAAGITDFYNVIDFKHLSVKDEVRENDVTKYLLLYDVTVTDKNGVKYYCKVYFTVDNSGDNHKFTIKKIE